MDWHDIARLVAPTAPFLGSLLGGLIPIPGGSLIGQEAGTLLARVLGVEPTPDSVAVAIKGTPQEILLAKIAAAQEEAKAKWPALAQMESAKAHEGEVQVTEVNRTARAELDNDSLFKSGWRPATGWVLCYLIAVIGTTMVVTLIYFMMTGNGEPWKEFIAALPYITFFLGIPATVCGIYGLGRSLEKSSAYKSGLGTTVTTTKRS